MLAILSTLVIAALVNPWPEEPTLVNPWPEVAAAPVHLCLTHNQYDHHIEAASAAHDVPVALIKAVIYTESKFKPMARSRVGARGLMQIMPRTARSLGIKNAYDPEQNIMGGTLYLRRLLDYFDGDLVLVVAGYNAGPGAVLKHGRRVPPYKQTRRYVKRVLEHIEHQGGLP